MSDYSIVFFIIMVSGVFLFLDGDKVFGRNKYSNKWISWVSLILFIGGFIGLVVYKIILL